MPSAAGGWSCSPGATTTEPAAGVGATVVTAVEERLRAVATADRAAHEKAYLKSDLDFLGATVPAIRSATKAVAREHDLTGHDEVAAAVEALWARPVHELRMAAVELLDLRSEVLSPDDVPLLERLLRESRTWALVDSLAASVVGALVERHPTLADDVLDRWVTDDDLWIRRSALLALLIPLRRGEGDPDRFLRYADALLDETEFFIRKAIGWVLREMARHRPDVVADWVEARLDRISGVTIREAVKHLPTERGAALLAAYRAR